MRELTIDGRDACTWRDVPDFEIREPGQALVRPLVVVAACCDLDVAVAQGRLPIAPGHAVGQGVGAVPGDSAYDSRSRRPVRDSACDQA